jgi:membrane protein implicated in regulation of membrane protease activity
MAEAFLICFFVGLLFTVISFILSGVFGGHDHAGHAEANVGVDADVDVDVAFEADVGVDVGEIDVGDVDVGDIDVDHGIEMGHDFDHDVAEAGDGHVEVGIGDTFPGLSPWSPTVLCSFLTTFGGVGYISLEAVDLGVPGSVLLGTVAAFVFAGGVFIGMNKIFAALQSSSEVRVADLKGRRAEVITPIPEGGVGEIAYEVSGTRQSAPARTVNGKPVGRAEKVKIVRIAGTTYLVKRV